MSRVLAYLRTSTDKQDLSNQKLAIYECARNKSLTIDEFIEISISSRRTAKERRIEEISSMLNESDTIIVTELSRLGRSTAEVIGIVNELLKKHVRVIIMKQNMDITEHDIQSKVMITFCSLFAELERDLISMRTKEALANKKAKGIVLGKPLGTIQRSKFDANLPRIQELLDLGLPVTKIAKHLGYSNPIGLSNYLKKRLIKPHL